VAVGKKNKNLDRKGLALVLVLFLILFISSIVALLSEIFITDIKIVQNHTDQIELLYVADAGIEYVISQLVQNRAWTADNLTIEFPAGSGNSYRITFPRGGGGTTIQSVGSLANGTTKVYQAQIRISGRNPPYQVRMTNWKAGVI